MKPDRKIFERAIAAANRPAEALFFIDDREENIVAARQLGMKARKVRPARCEHHRDDLLDDA